ncbi:hypothetical protein ACQ7CX_05420 [Chryseobacterium arthrosphaerae]|uniref:hypothetical protein n=1 Tax=Chryseobacterium arthrosphaerae TaxID=651561 RepID=UPI001BAF7959|nr:hypothetical protein [Chryseobacterium arthrosphaerae]QUY57072.1 hypothetical protein I2F65_07020 [Chryseobacterium arthrosphaerae]
MDENQKLDLKSFMDYLKENLATISLYMSSIGVVYTLSYYFFWNINIIYYLNLSEVILLSVQYLTGLALTCLFFLVTHIFFSKVYIFDKVPEDKGLSILLLASILGFVIISFIEEFRIEVLAIMIIGFAVIYVYVKKGNIKFQKLIRYLAVIMLFLTIGKAVQDFYKIRYCGESKRERLTFTVNNIEYKEDKNLLLVGMTENYLFMFDKAKSKKLIFRRDEIKFSELESIK